jgi:hypothetical protein
MLNIEAIYTCYLGVKMAAVVAAAAMSKMAFVGADVIP